MCRSILVQRSNLQNLRAGIRPREVSACVRSEQLSVREVYRQPDSVLNGFLAVAVFQTGFVEMLTNSSELRASRSCGVARVVSADHSLSRCERETPATPLHTLQLLHLHMTVAPLPLISFLPPAAIRKIQSVIVYNRWIDLFSFVLFLPR